MNRKSISQKIKKYYEPSSIQIIVQNKAILYKLITLAKLLKSYFPNSDLCYRMAIETGATKEFIKQNKALFDNLNLIKLPNKTQLASGSKMIITFNDEKPMFHTETKNKTIELRLPISLFKQSIITQHTDQELLNLKIKYGIDLAEKLVIFGNLQSNNPVENDFYRRLAQELINKGYQILMVPNSVEDSNLKNFMLEGINESTNIHIVDENSVKPDGKPALIWGAEQGSLSKLYHLSSFTFLGGLYNPSHGIQNPIEPLVAGNIMFSWLNPNNYTGSNSDLLLQTSLSPGIHKLNHSDKHETQIAEILGIIDNLSANKEILSKLKTDIINSIPLDKDQFHKILCDIKLKYNYLNLEPDQDTSNGN
ncbi:MAG: hypothetical protein A2Y40_10350 [Candidatus Margulisbacteria bacterium GWF2_35_9]|nr:MAG: hypothetical protein A2Y40_10350 [Candidatus Margulisbacteria bacterium GWF2_35_9]